MRPWRDSPGAIKVQEDVPVAPAEERREGCPRSRMRMRQTMVKNTLIEAEVCPERMRLWPSKRPGRPKTMTWDASATAWAASATDEVTADAVAAAKSASAAD